MSRESENSKVVDAQSYFKTDICCWKKDLRFITLNLALKEFQGLIVLATVPNCIKSKHFLFLAGLRKF